MYINIHSLHHDTQNWAQCNLFALIICQVCLNMVGVHLW